MYWSLQIEPFISSIDDFWGWSLEMFTDPIYQSIDKMIAWYS